MGGFKVPILHGLCTFGIAGKHILKSYCDNDPAKFKSIKVFIGITKVRFVKHVFPGETLETRMWKEGSKIIFQVRVVERDVIAISNAAVELQGAATEPKAAIVSTGVNVSGFASSTVFAGVQASLSDESSRKQQVSQVLFSHLS